MLTANDTAGSYTVTASSAYGSVSFSLTNTAAGIPATITPLAPTSQHATVNSRYAQPLAVRVLDANGNPVVGANVTFSLGSAGGRRSGWRLGPRRRARASTTAQPRPPRRPTPTASRPRPGLQRERHQRRVHRDRHRRARHRAGPLHARQPRRQAAHDRPGRVEQPHGDDRDALRPPPAGDGFATPRAGRSRARPSPSRSAPPPPRAPPPAAAARARASPAARPRPPRRPARTASRPRRALAANDRPERSPRPRARAGPAASALFHLRNRAGHAIDGHRRRRRRPVDDHRHALRDRARRHRHRRPRQPRRRTPPSRSPHPRPGRAAASPTARPG